jgi:peptidyl-prolyl cis-trans isomerase D
MRRGEVAHFERGAGGLPLGSDADLNREVFSDASLSQRGVGGPLPLGEDRMVVFQVQDHAAASTKPLDDVRAEITKAIMRDRGAEAAYAAAQAAVADLEKGASFAQVAGKLKGKVEGPRFIGRGSPDVPVELRDALFAAPRPEPGKPVRQALKIEGVGVAVFESGSARVQSFSANAQLNEMRSQRELQRYSRRDIEGYLDDIVGSAKVTRNPQAFQQ